jgi:hypothetical protein
MHCCFEKKGVEPMTIHLRWDNPDDKSVIWYDFDADWTWDDLYLQSEAAHKMRDTVPHRVDTILDMSKVEASGIPRSAVTHFKNIAQIQTAYSEQVIVITKDRFIRTLFRATEKLSVPMQESFHMVDTHEEAQEVLNGLRASSTDDAAS